ncbi:hypothetical protein A3731_14440 [Roseovarius sp. HI0049]|nr:hypothetical protein A3731_14440 [Roseovarius sp. HI0049]
MPFRLVFVTALLLAAAAALPLRAAELVMVEQPGCHWCQLWHEEIGVSYAKTEEASRAPLRRVRIGDLPPDIDFATTPVFTPTFVLVHDGAELGRIEGYPGAHFFWPMLTQLLDAHPGATGQDGS